MKVLKNLVEYRWKISRNLSMRPCVWPQSDKLGSPPESRHEIFGLFFRQRSPNLISYDFTGQDNFWQLFKAWKIFSSWSPLSCFHSKHSFEHVTRKPDFSYRKSGKSLKSKITRRYVMLTNVKRNEFGKAEGQSWSIRLEKLFDFVSVKKFRQNLEK